MKIFVAMMVAMVVLSVGAPVRAYAAVTQASGEQATPEAVSPEANEVEHDENEQYLHSAMVKKLSKMMGVSTETGGTIFIVTNFAVLLLALGFGAMKILPKTFRDRNTAIQKQLVDARTATEEASIRLNSVEERLSHLDAQIAEMKMQAERDSAADEARIKASVEEETKKILATADQEIAAASMHAQRQLQQYAAELAIEQAAKKLVISAETDRLLVQNFARRLGGDESKGGQN
jgi:F-type H+-transporting ATPase subunit b